MKLVSIFGGHDANVTFYDSERSDYRVIEIERLVKKRYFDWSKSDSEEATKILKNCRDIAEKFWGFDKFDAVILAADGIDHGNSKNIKILEEVFETQNFHLVTGHHLCHAACSFYQSPYERASIISYDGGGNDGFFNIYEANRKDHTFECKASIKSDFGGGYLVSGMLLKEVSEKGHPQSYAGKMMGLSAYGNVIEELIEPYSIFLFERKYEILRQSIFDYLVKHDRDNPWLRSETVETARENLVKLGNDPAVDKGIFEGQLSYDLAATAQAAFEKSFFNVFKEFINDDESHPLCLSGGGSLNVLVNERLKNYKKHVFVPPNPNDCGISLGAMFFATRPESRVNVTYNGIPTLDRSTLETQVKERNAKKVNVEELASLIKRGNIVGVLLGDSEVGPRALGNRSIVCDPSFSHMKDHLNKKVKFREWFRPFAPFCRDVDVDKYFISSNFSNMESMSFAPMVKKEYIEKLSSITHVDETARLQVVSEKSHSFFGTF